MEFETKFKEIQLLYLKLIKIIDRKTIENKIKEFESIVAEPNFWDEQVKAQKISEELVLAKQEISNLDDLDLRVKDIAETINLLEEFEKKEVDELKIELEKNINELSKELQQLEVNTFLTGENDSRNAIITIRSGAGGEDAADWANMLLRMYSRWADKNNYKYNIYDISYASEGGIKSASMFLDFKYAYGKISTEKGIHRLVRISPFDSQARRHTSFAEVEVLPLVDVNDKISIPSTDLKIDVFRSSGPGGQSVNTTDSAVRITHIPTGLIATSQNEKSQLQNKNSAMKVLESRLLEKRQLEEKKKLNILKGETLNSWGGQMRSYILQPYQMVKDHRTGLIDNNPQDVLGGKIDEFINSAIKWRIDNNIDS